MRERLAQREKLYYNYAMERCFVGAVEIYCEAVERLSQSLCALDVKSRGLARVPRILERVCRIGFLPQPCTEAGKLKSDLSAIRYGLLIKDGSVTVRHYDGEIDYSAMDRRTFENSGAAQRTTIGSSSEH